MFFQRELGFYTNTGKGVVSAKKTEMAAQCDGTVVMADVMTTDGVKVLDMTEQVKSDSNVSGVHVVPCEHIHIVGNEVNGCESNHESVGAFDQEHVLTCLKTHDYYIFRKGMKDEDVEYLFMYSYEKSFKQPTMQCLLRDSKEEMTRKQHIIAPSHDVHKQIKDIGDNIANKAGLYSFDAKDIGLLRVSLDADHQLEHKDQSDTRVFTYAIMLILWPRKFMANGVAIQLWPGDVLLFTGKLLHHGHKTGSLSEEMPNLCSSEYLNSNIPYVAMKTSSQIKDLKYDALIEAIKQDLFPSAHVRSRVRDTLSNFLKEELSNKLPWTFVLKDIYDHFSANGKGRGFADAIHMYGGIGLSRKTPSNEFVMRADCIGTEYEMNIVNSTLMPKLPGYIKSGEMRISEYNIWLDRMRELTSHGLIIYSLTDQFDGKLQATMNDIQQFRKLKSIVYELFEKNNELTFDDVISKFKQMCSITPQLVDQIIYQNEQKVRHMVTDFISKRKRSTMPSMETTENGFGAPKTPIVEAILNIGTSNSMQSIQETLKETFKETKQTSVSPIVFSDKNPSSFSIALKVSQPQVSKVSSSQVSSSQVSSSQVSRPQVPARARKQKYGIKDTDANNHGKKARVMAIVNDDDADNFLRGSEQQLKQMQLKKNKLVSQSLSDQLSGDTFKCIYCYQPLQNPGRIQRFCDIGNPHRPNAKPGDIDPSCCNYGKGFICDREKTYSRVKDFHRDKANTYSCMNRKCKKSFDACNYCLGNYAAASR